MPHGTARLTVYDRTQFIRHREAGYTAAVIAEMIGASRATVYKWLRRYRCEGTSGLVVRSSRPQRTPHALTPQQVRLICRAGRTLQYGPHRLSYELRVPRSTIYGVLRRSGLHRLASLHPHHP